MIKADCTDGIDVGLSAVGMVRYYGLTAEREAIARARKFAKSNNQMGVNTWTAIAHVIRQGTHAACFEKSLPKIS